MENKLLEPLWREWCERRDKDSSEHLKGSYWKEHVLFTHKQSRRSSIPTNVSFRLSLNFIGKTMFSATQLVLQ